MFNEMRIIGASIIASGLLSKHGIDHGGLDADQIADRSLAIAESIIMKVEAKTTLEQVMERLKTVGLEPLPKSDPGTPVPAPQPDPPTDDHSADGR